MQAIQNNRVGIGPNEIHLYETTKKKYDF